MSDQFDDDFDDDVEDDFIGDVDAINQPYTQSENSEIDAEYELDVVERDEMLGAVIDSVDDDIDDEDFASEDDLADEFAAVFGEQAQSKPVVVMEELPVTGEPRVDDALARLNDLASLPVSEHVAVFEDVQRRLHETLSDLSGQ